MDPAQLNRFIEENKKSTAEAIKLHVNGKIDKMDKELKANHVKVKKALDGYNKQHENDMKRIMPVLEAFEASQRAMCDAKKGGKIILWIAGFITAVGGAWLIIKSCFNF